MDARSKHYDEVRRIADLLSDAVEPDTPDAEYYRVIHEAIIVLNNAYMSSMFDMIPLQRNEPVDLD